MSNKKILVVEDDADVRLGYQILLKANHYETFFAADGLFAIRSKSDHPNRELAIVRVRHRLP